MLLEESTVMQGTSTEAGGNIGTREHLAGITGKHQQSGGTDKWSGPGGGGTSVEGSNT